MAISLLLCGERSQYYVGYYPTMKLGKARADYQTLFDLWQSGVDPKAHLAKLEEAKTNTVKKLVIGWYENYIEKERKNLFKIFYLKYVIPRLDRGIHDIVNY